MLVWSQSIDMIKTSADFEWIGEELRDPKQITRQWQFTPLSIRLSNKSMLGVMLPKSFHTHLASLIDGRNRISPFIDDSLPTSWASVLVLVMTQPRALGSLRRWGCFCYNRGSCSPRVRLLVAFYWDLECMIQSSLTYDVLSPFLWNEVALCLFSEQGSWMLAWPRAFLNQKRNNMESP